MVSWWAIGLLLIITCASLAAASNVTYDHRSLIIDGKRRLLFSGSIHYPRATPEMWPRIIENAKLGGLDVIETYVFWNLHEPSPGNYSFQGRHDLVKFIRVVQKAGLLVNLRIGPYACAEWNFGGFPVWLRDIPGIVFRTNNEPFKERMQSFLSKIVNVMKEHQLFASQGGPIILAQVENEYGNVEYAYGNDGPKYIAWASQMAQSQNIGVPWIMCVQSGAPDYILTTCNGMYCDTYTPNANQPMMWTEGYTGWIKYYGGYTPHRPVEDIAFAVARFFEVGGSFNSYYMYFGGTNFGRTSGGPYVTTSYDYDAPIDEYGDIRDPKWSHLRDLHATLKQCEETLLANEPQKFTLGSLQEAHMYTNRTISSLSTDLDLDLDLDSGCVAFLANIDSKLDASVKFNGNEYVLPAWSVTILPDCKHAGFNSAVVNAQFSLAATKSAKSSVKMKWKSYNESIGIWGNSFTAKGLLEQIHTTQDTTDYLWYTTSVDVDHKYSAAISIESMRDVAHIFVNGEYQGSAQTGLDNLYTEVVQPVKLKRGRNEVDILSVTVGLQHFGPFIETWNAGINGSVLIKGLPNGDEDLSYKDWTYQVGLKGEHEKIFTREGSQAVKWSSSSTKKRPLTWYKAEFDGPIGGKEEGLALDLGSMGKGEAWVNGESIGRFWPKLNAPNSTSCSERCDYRGNYDPDTKCYTGCGQPSQRWYHVPRAWVKEKGNILVLFEEVGGDPVGISLVTRSVEFV